MRLSKVRKGRGRGRCAGLHCGGSAQGVRRGGRLGVGPARSQTRYGMGRPPSLPAIDLLRWYDNSGAAIWLCLSLISTTRSDSIASSVCLPYGRTKERYDWKPDDPRAENVRQLVASTRLLRCGGDLQSRDMAVAAVSRWHQEAAASRGCGTRTRGRRATFSCVSSRLLNRGICLLPLPVVLWRLRRAFGALCAPYPQDL